MEARLKMLERTNRVLCLGLALALLPWVTWALNMDFSFSTSDFSVGGFIITMNNQRDVIIAEGFIDASKTRK
jgi:hypothetical protein